MVCIAGLQCVIKFNLYHGAKDKNLTNTQLLLNETTRGRDLYKYIEEFGHIQPDSFKLYLLSAGEVIDLSEMKDKTMSEIGVDFSFSRDPSESKHTILVLDPTSTDFCINNLMQKQIEYNLPTYNPPPSPNHSSVWNEDNVEFKSLIKPEICYVGLVNQAMTCYLNSLLQALFMTPEFRNALYNWEYIEGSEKDEANSIPYQLQKLFLNLQTSTKSAVETTALTKSFGWDSTEAWQQHDIQELCRVMFDALEQKFRNTEQADLINRLYEGKMIDYVKCLECSTEKSREDTFLDIPLPVRPFGSNVAYSSVEEALRAFVQYETLEGNNQYFCEKCNKKCDAHKGLKFTKFPYLLTIHLKRFDFDFKTFHRIKLNDKVTFPDILNLNPFISSTPNQISPNSDENIGLVKCDDSSTTDSGTLDDDYVLSENNLPNNNHSTNHDQDDDEGIDINNGPSTSNCIVHNLENEKNRNSSAAKGPYNYELFSIMIHSGSASGGHYYAYIKDFRTQEWLCFNDQSVTQITHDDIQKTYGGGPSRPYYRASSSCANAYMLMYRQIDSVRNALPMQVQDFPKHIQELLDKMKERSSFKIPVQNEDNDLSLWRNASNDEILSEIRMLQAMRDRTIAGKKMKAVGIEVKLYCGRPNDNTLHGQNVCLVCDATWAETTKHVYNNYCSEELVDFDQCRLVAFNDQNREIVASYEGRENEPFLSIWNNQMPSLLLEIRDKDQKFESLPNRIVTKVFIVDVPTRKLIEGPITVRSSLTQTVREYKQMVGKVVNMDLSEMVIILRKHESDTIVISNDDAELQASEFCNMINVFMSRMLDTEYKSFFDTTIRSIAEELENIITLRIKLPDTSKETLEELNIPPLEEEQKEKEKPATPSPSKVSVNDTNHDVGPKCSEVSKNAKTTDDTLVRNASPQLGESEEWNTPEQSNSSEDSSLSDSDKTLVGDAPEDDLFQLPYSYYLASKNRAIKMLNQNEHERWEHNIDEPEYYFKAIQIRPSFLSNYQKFMKVLVDKRMIFDTFKKHLEPYIGVRSEDFKIFRDIDESDEPECSLFNRFVCYEDGEDLCVKLTRALRSGEFKVKLYQFFIDSLEPFKYLFEWTLSEGMSVGQAKKKILEEMKRKYEIDIPYERCRLRKKCFNKASKVLLDDQKFDLPHYSQFHIIVQELPDKEVVTNSDQVIVFVRKWSPEKMELEALQEIVLDGKSVEELYKKLSSISDIPEKHIDVAKTKGSFSYSFNFRIHDFEWNASATDIELSIQDGIIFIYKDKRETEKYWTQERFGEIVFRLSPPSSASRYSVRREKALRINLDTE